MDHDTSLIADKAAYISKKTPDNMPVEAILALQPDLVIVQENTNKAYVEAIKDTGLKVFVTKKVCSMISVLVPVYVMELHLLV